MQLDNAVVFVTGANRGLGLAFAKVALAAGARKVYAGARDPASITLAGVEPVALDVTRPDAIAAAARACGDVSLLVNNAGISRRSALFGPDSAEALQAELQTNLLGPLEMSRAFAPILAAQGGGAIVNVLSVLSWISLDAVATYSISKAAAWSMTNGLRNALRAQRTQVVALHVAFMDTDMTRGVPGTKTQPDDVARQAYDAVREGRDEVLADTLTEEVKRGLSAEPGVYLRARG